MLKFDNVGIAYGKKEILSGVNAQIEKGKLTVLVGKNGSGKSSLLSALVGQVPFSGSVLLDSKPITSFSPRERARLLTLMPQMLPETAFTVEELAFMGRNPHLSLGAKYTQEDHEAAEYALMLAQVGHLRSCPVNRLSGGERRLAFLAMAIAQNTDLLLFDEPTANLDAPHARHLLQCVQRLVHEQNKTVLMVLHDLNAALSVADRIICLDDKQCVFNGTKQEFLQADISNSVFGLQKTQAADVNGNLKTVFYF